MEGITAEPQAHAGILREIMASLASGQLPCRRNQAAWSSRNTGALDRTLLCRSRTRRAAKFYRRRVGTVDGRLIKIERGFHVSGMSEEKLPHQGGLRCNRTATPRLIAAIFSARWAPARWWRLAPRCRKPKPIRKTTMKSAKLATKRTLRTSKRFTASTTIPSEGGNRADQEDRSSGAPRLPCGARRPKHCSRPASVFAPFRDQRRQPRRAWHDATWDRPQS